VKVREKNLLGSLGVKEEGMISTQIRSGVSYTSQLAESSPAKDEPPGEVSHLLLNTRSMRKISRVDTGPPVSNSSKLHRAVTSYSL
jgi:hypothetical protein